MTPDIEITEADGTYEPMPVIACDGDAIILDPIDFAERYNCDAVINKDGQLFVLDKTTHKWRPCEELEKAARKLSTVKP